LRHRNRNSGQALLSQKVPLTASASGSMNDEQFYINYSVNGEHFIMGPYHSRRFAMSHIDDVRRQPGVSNVFLGNQPPAERPYRQRVPITMSVEER
jgi:hypothetical protein